MRYLLDTNIFIYASIEPDYLSRDVAALFEDYDNIFCMSAESVKELIIGFNNNKIVSKYWKSTGDIVNAIRENFHISILPVGEEQMNTYAHLKLNQMEKHNDPSDHVIISHAITNRIPLISSDRKFKFYKKQGLVLVFNEK